MKAEGFPQLRNLLADSAQEVPWNEHDVYLITAPDEWVFVLSGEVDAFAVQMEAGTPTGPWHALGRLGAGLILTGPTPGPGHRLLLRRVGASRVVGLSVNALRSQAQRAPEEFRAEVVAGVENGMLALAGTLSDALPPRDFVAISAGRTLEVQPGDTMRAVDRLIWLRVLEGEALLGATGRRVSAGDELCVTRQDWLKTVTGLRVLASSGSETLGGGHLWRRTSQHWTDFLAALDKKVLRHADDEANRLRGAQQRDAGVEARIREANDRLLQGEAEYVVDDGDDTARDHVIAIQYVLESQNRASLRTPSLRDVASSFDEISNQGWVRTRKLKLEGKWWLQDMGPLVTLWGSQRRPAAMIRISNRYIVRASWLDAPELVTAENQHQAGRQAWMIYPRLPASVASVGALLKHGLRGMRGEYWTFGLITIVIGLLGLLTPILNGQVLGSFVESADRAMILQAGAAVLASALVAGAFSVVQNLTTLRVQGTLTAHSQAGVWSRLLDLPVRFFNQYAAGRLATVVLSVKAAEGLLTGVVIAASLGLVTALSNLVLIFFLDVKLALVATAIVVVAVAICVPAVRRTLEYERARFEEEQVLVAMGYEALSAIAKIRCAAAEERTFLRWARQSRLLQTHQMASRKVQDHVAAINGVLPLLGTAAIFVAANLFSPVPAMTTLLTFMTAFTLLLSAVLQFTGSMMAVVAMVPMLESLTPILEEPTETGEGRVSPGDLSGQVTLRQLSFRYHDDGPMVLDGIQLDVKPGEFVGIVGPSGSGKSSIIRLLLGFEQPESGSVLFDGQELTELDLTSVRGQCGVVLQGGALLPGDIRANIAGGGNFTDDEVWTAADMAGFGDVIREMPMGLATLVSETGQGLSGGQVQRLMIARALVNRPRLVIFDEATSALDNPTQRIVAEATRQLNATRIVVAHRLSTIRDADRIIVMDRGRIVQEGTYDQLAGEGVFAELVRMQDDFVA